MPELLYHVGFDAWKEKKMFLVSTTNEPEDEMELRSGATLSQRDAMLLERKVESVHVMLHGTECGSQDVARAAVCGQEVSMGTRMGPSYACLFVGYVERSSFQS
eukprot:g35831.t1